MARVGKCHLTRREREDFEEIAFGWEDGPEPFEDLLVDLLVDLEDLEEPEAA